MITSPGSKNSKISPSVTLTSMESVNENDMKRRDEERDILLAEKTRLENYLKVYSQRINSLSTVVLSYQNQLKLLQEKLKQPLMKPQLTGHKKIAEKDESDDNESFAQYEIESEANSIVPHKFNKAIPANVSNEIISFKNILIQAQQEELDNLKNEIVKGTSVYVLMTANEKAEWDKYRAIGHSFTLIDKLRESVPPNTKWIDKNVHKVIQSAIELYEVEKTYSPNDLTVSIADLKSKQEYFDKMINDIKNMNQDKINNFGKGFMNYYAIILTLMTENWNNAIKLYETNFETWQTLMNLKMRNASLEDDIKKIQTELADKNQQIINLNTQVNTLKCKNSRIFQENWLLNRFLSSKPGQTKDYMVYSNESLLKENEYLKAILSKQVPYNYETTQSLSFYRIQYHLLKKKFANISLATQNKNAKALEEALSDCQKQLLESEYASNIANMPSDQTSSILFEQIVDCKFEIKQLNDNITELSSSNTKLRKKIDLSKDVLNNYEQTIEKLHREIEYLKVKNGLPNIKYYEKYIEKGESGSGSKINTDDLNVVKKLLTDVEQLKLTIEKQWEQLALVNFENDKLLNLYQNKDKVLNDKRNELAELQTNYDELNELYKQATDVDENLELDPNDIWLKTLLKITQKEKTELKNRLRDSERNLQQLRIEHLIAEEKEYIYKRELTYMESTKMQLQAELENSNNLIIRMENHINMLNTLLLPHEYVRKISDPIQIETPNFYGLNVQDNSDSSDDDMLADYGAIPIQKPADMLQRTETVGTKSAHIDHIDFMNCRQIINEAKRDALVLKNQNEILNKHNEINRSLLKQLSYMAAVSFSHKSGNWKSKNSSLSLDARNDKIIKILLNGKHDELGLDDRSKLKILQQIHIESENSDLWDEAILYRKLAQDFKKELDDMIIQNQNYESILKIKNQQIESLHKISLKTFIDSDPLSQNDPGTTSEALEKQKLSSELSKSRSLNKELDKKLDSLQAKYNAQVEQFNQILVKIKDLQDVPKQNLESEGFKLELEYKQAKIIETRQEVAEAWDLIERINDHKLLLLKTNKELQDELNAYKLFFSSKYDTLDRESSSAYLSLLSLRKENELLMHKLEKCVIENKYLKKSVSHSKSLKPLENSILNDYDRNSINVKFDATNDSLKEQLIASKTNEFELIYKYEDWGMKNDFLLEKNKQLQETVDELINQKFELHNEIINQKEYNAKLRVQSSLGPEVMEKLGHGGKPSSDILLENVKSSDKASGKIPLHNILKGEADGVNEVLNLLHKNKLLEEDLQSAKTELEKQRLINQENEAKLHGLSRLEHEAKDIARNHITDPKTFSNQSERINALLLKIKAREVELNILNNERGDVSRLKQELLQTKQVIMTHDIVPDLYQVLSKYGDAIPIQMIKSMVITMHHKYNEHVLELFEQLNDLKQKSENSNTVALKAQFYLKSKVAENKKLKNTIQKYEHDLKEKRDDELKLLERIISISMQKYKPEATQKRNVEVTPTKTLDPDKKNDKSKKGKGKQKPSKSPIRVQPEKIESDIKEIPVVEENSNVKEISKPITLESHAAALQRRVYLLKTDNDKLKLDLHNSNQNYLEIKDQYFAIQEIMNSYIKPELQDSAVDSKYNLLNSEFKSIISKLESIETGELSIKEYDNLITDGRLKQTVSTDKRLFENIQSLQVQNELQLKQCKAKWSIHELIKLFIVSSSELDKEEINTEKERVLVQKITELEASNKSLRQNLIDTLNDLKISEKENELIFSEKLKLQKQLDEEASNASFYSIHMSDHKHQQIEEPPEVTKEELIPELTPKVDNSKMYDNMIEEDNELFAQNEKLIYQTDNMIDKYNNMIKKNLTKAKNISKTSTTDQYVAKENSGFSNLHKIDETENDVKSDQSLSLINIDTSRQAQDEEAKQFKMPRGNLNYLSSDKEANVIGTKSKAKPDANIDKVIGIIEDLENDLKQSYHKDQTNEFFEKRNKNNKSLTSAVSKKDGIKKIRNKSKGANQLLPDLSIENETISASSRVPEKHKLDENESKSTAQFKIKPKKGQKTSTKQDKTNLPPVPKAKKI